MLTKRALLVTAMIILAIAAFLGWTAWNDAQLGWVHIIGMGASVLLLVLIWF
jgi:predicted negative regulator of RcsB-dependent stress response